MSKKLATLVLGTLLVISPVAASAQTADVQAQIRALQEMIQVLLKQIAALTAQQNPQGGSPVIALTAPADGSTLLRTANMPISWTVKNVPRTMLVVGDVTLIAAAQPYIGSIGGGSFQQVVQPGTSESSHVWQWGLNDSIVGTYKASLKLQECPAQGCVYNANYPGTVPTPVLATSNAHTFIVANGQGSKPSCYVSANKKNAYVGESVRFTWWSSDNTTGIAAKGANADELNGSMEVVMGQAGIYEYLISVTGPGGTGTCTASVDVWSTTPPPTAQPTCSMRVLPAVVKPGSSATLMWSSTGADYVMLTTGSVSERGNASGTTTFNNITAEKSFSMAAHGAGGTGTCTTKVSVTPVWQDPATTTPPAAGTSLYSLSVNNATNAKSNFCYSDWGTINVTIAADAKSPLILALDSYEPVKWNIINASGKKINKIITTGYHAQMVSGAVSGVPVEHHSMYQIGKAGKLTYNSNDFFYKAGAPMPSRLYDWPTDPSCKATSGAIPLASRMYFTAQSDYALGAGSATSGEYKSMLQKLKTWSGGLTPTASRVVGSTAAFTIGATKVSYLEEQLALEGGGTNVASAAAAYQQLIDVLSDIVSFLGQ